MSDEMTSERPLSAERFPVQAAAWFRSDAADRVVRRYRHHDLTRYLEVCAAGADEARVLHARGNARGRFYEHVILSALSHVLLASPDSGVEFACAGGRAPLGGAALSRTQKRDIVLEAPSFAGGQPVVRGEFDGLVWDAAQGLVMVEMTASPQGFGDLMADIWRKQAIAAHIYDLEQSPRVVVISPHDKSGLARVVPRLTAVIVPYPELLWAAVADPMRPASRGSHPPPERIGANLEGARALDYGRVLARLRRAVIGAIRSGVDLQAFYAGHRDRLLLTGRVYLGELRGPQAVAVTEAVLAGYIATPGTPVPDLRAEATRVHVALRCEHHRHRLTTVLHVLTRTPEGHGEYRITAGRSAKWIKSRFKRLALRREWSPDHRRTIDGELVLAAVAACDRMARDAAQNQPVGVVSPV